jgi:tetratricopeptide (TPR) repeat protein
MALFERALFDHPRDFWLHLNAAILTREPGIKIGLAVAARAIRPRSAVAYIILAFSLAERGDWPEAVVAADRAIEINPDYSTAYYLRGRLALRDKKDLPRAAAAFQRAIDLDPGSGASWWSLGEVFRLQGNGAAAADAYRKGADRVGLAVRDIKDLAGAEVALKREIELHPGDFQVRHTLGQLLQQQGRYTEAQEAYLGAFKAQPACVPSYDALARLLATCPDDQARDGKRAIEYATTACERTGWKDPLCLDTLAAAYAEAGQFEEAVRYQTRALEDPALKSDLRTAARGRLELYRQKKPFRDPGP